MLDALTKKGRFNETEAAGSLRGVIDALVYCHDNKITHRDIKLENLFYQTPDSESTVKMGDFGLSHMKGTIQQDQSLMTTNCGTLEYQGR
jgi:serine/threonine protein kinase